MFQSEVVHAALAEGWPLGGWGTMVTAPIFKWWSPMSIGAWAVALFGAWSFLSFVVSFRSNGFLARMVGRTWFKHIFQVAGSGIGFFVASYTGVLLSATNQPVWSVSDWIAPLFLTSATSTAVAVLLLLGRSIAPATRSRLERADLWALGLELGLFLIFLASLGSLLPLVLTTWQGWLLVGGTLLAGLLIPLLLHFAFENRATLAALFALAGGFLLRFGIVSIAPALLHLPAEQALDSVDQSLYSTWSGQGLLVLTVVLAGAIPVLLRKQWSLDAGPTLLACIASVVVTAGVLFYALGVKDWRLSPEEGRARGGGVGASFFNRPAVIHLRTKIVKDE
jgi:formate-dependent nitrite reductase membrane component NrfD